MSQECWSAVQADAPWSYKPGASNLFGAMAERVEEALRAAPEGSRVAGMLWYQVNQHGDQLPILTKSGGVSSQLCRPSRLLGPAAVPWAFV